MLGIEPIVGPAAPMIASTVSKRQRAKRHEPMTPASRLSLALAATILLLVAYPVRRSGRLRQPGGVREREARVRPEHVAGQRSRRLDDPGLRHVDERQQGRDGPLQDQDDRLQLPHRHLQAGLLPGPRRPSAGGGDPPDGHAAPDAAHLPDDRVDGPDRLRELGRVRVMDRPGRHGVRGLHRSSGARRQRRREPDPVRGPRRRVVVGDAGQDLGRDVAGLQQVRRQQPVLVHRVSSGEPLGLPGRVLGLLQPAVRRHDRPGHRALVSVLRRVPDDPVHRAQRLRRELHEPAGRRQPTPRSCATTS